MKKFYTLKYDSVFKNVFFKNEELLKKLLTSILREYQKEIEIKNRRIRNCELTKEKIYIKNKLVDLLVETNDKVLNIEINSVFSEIIKMRNLIYLCSSISNSIHKKEEYRDIKEFIQINFNWNEKSDDIITRYMLSNRDKIYTDRFQITNINIEKMLDEWYNHNRSNEYYKRYKYMLIVGMEKEDLDKIPMEDKDMKDIKDEINKLNEDEDFYQYMTDEEDEDFYQYMTDEEDEEKLRKSFYAEGKEEGIKEEKISNAKKMKLEGISLDTIKKITGLDINVIRNL